MAVKKRLVFCADDPASPFHGQNVSCLLCALASPCVPRFFMLGFFACPLITLQFTRYFVSLCQSLDALPAYRRDVDRSRADVLEPLLRSEPCHRSSIRQGECEAGRALFQCPMLITVTQDFHPERPTLVSPSLY